MPFPKTVREQALVNSGRCCCVCHKGPGIELEVHHIKQEADGGKNTLDNAIALCFDCHAAAGHYNNHHPRGTKYSPSELRSHRDKWWDWYSKNSNAPLPNEVISVMPRKVRLWVDDRRSEAIIRVHNKSNEIYYRIPIIFTISQPGVSADAISIEMKRPVDDDMFSSHPDGAKVSSEMALGMIDSQGRSILTWYLAALAPNEVRKFKFSHSIPDQLAPLTQAELLITIGDFSREPTQILRREVNNGTEILFGPFKVGG